MGRRAENSRFAAVERGALPHRSQITLFPRLSLS